MIERQKMITIKDMVKLSKAHHEPLLGTSNNLRTLPFMEEYLDNFARFDRTIQIEQGFFAPIWNLDDEETEDDVFEQFREDVFDFIFMHKKNYEHLYAVLTAEYEPLNNYDKTEDWTLDDSGNDVVTKNIGARVHTEDIDEKNESTTYGQKLDTNVTGSQTNNTNNTVSAFNSSSMQPSNATATTEGAKTDTFTESEHVDRIKSEGHIDQFRDAETTDSDTTTYGKKQTYHNRTVGNIGVTTSMQLLESESSMWQSFKFYDILFNDIVKNLCTFYSEGYKPF